MTEYPGILNELFKVWAKDQSKKINEAIKASNMRLDIMDECLTQLHNRIDETQKKYTQYCDKGLDRNEKRHKENMAQFNSHQKVVEDYLEGFNKLLEKVNGPKS